MLIKNWIHRHNDFVLCKADQTGSWGGGKYNIFKVTTDKHGNVEAEYEIKNSGKKLSKDASKALMIFNDKIKQAKLEEQAKAAELASGQTEKKAKKIEKLPIGEAVSQGYNFFDRHTKDGRVITLQFVKRDEQGRIFVRSESTNNVFSVDNLKLEVVPKKNKVVPVREDRKSVV